MSQHEIDQAVATVTGENMVSSITSALASPIRWT